MIIFHTLVICTYLVSYLAHRSEQKWL